MHPPRDAGHCSCRASRPLLTPCALVTSPNCIAFTRCIDAFAKLASACRISSGTASVGRTPAAPAPRPSGPPAAPRPARATSGSYPHDDANARTRSSTRALPVGNGGQPQHAVVTPQDALVGHDADHPLPRRGDVGDGLGQSLGPGQRDHDARGGPAGHVVGAARADQEAAARQLRSSSSDPSRSTSAAPRQPTVRRPRSTDDHAQDGRGVGEVRRRGEDPLVEDVGIGRCRLVPPQPELGRQHDAAPRRPGPAHRDPGRRGWPHRRRPARRRRRRRRPPARPPAPRATPPAPNG